MREIKFRAWYGNEFVHEEFFVKDGYAYIFDNDGACGDPDCCGQRDYFMTKTDWKVMQYTGLKDKNGKEIYEGDILENKSVVRFFDGKFHPVYDGGNAEEEEDPFRGDKREIIGNIYENPDLLK